MSMATSNGKSRCARARQRMIETLNDRPAAWLLPHVADCPRCRRLLLGRSRIDLGLLLLKSQPHRSDLLMRANCRATAVLSRRLRDLPKARMLRRAMPRPSLRQRMGGYTQAVVNAAACLIVLLLMRMGIFSSVARLHDEGARVVEQYYARHLDQDILDQLR